MNKKLTLLEILSKEPKPIGLHDLLKKLGNAFAERSVRRWLREMEAGGALKRIGRKRATQYQIAQQTSCFSKESLSVIEKIRLPIYEREPCTYREDWFEKYQPNSTYYIGENIRALLHNTGKRSKVEDPAGTYARKIFDRLLIDLSYNSSRLEGNTYSLLDTKKLLLENLCAEGKLDEERVMILNHKEAINYLVKTIPHLAIKRETICTLHYLLADGLLEGPLAGKVRNHDVRIGGSTYIPIENRARLERQLERIVEKSAFIKDPYEQSFFLLVHISYLQAFSDVNKRTSRLSANIPLIAHNLVPLSFNDVNREDYTSAIIAIYEQQDVRPLIDLYVFSYLRTCTAYDTTVQSISFDEVRVRYRGDRRDLLRECVLKQLVGDPLNATVLETARRIPAADRNAFIEDVWEDIENIDLSRISGLGITPDELNVWLNKRFKDKRRKALDALTQDAQTLDLGY